MCGLLQEGSSQVHHQLTFLDKLSRKRWIGQPGEDLFCAIVKSKKSMGENLWYIANTSQKASWDENGIKKLDLRRLIKV